MTQTDDAHDPSGSAPTEQNPPPFTTTVDWFSLPDAQLQKFATLGSAAGITVSLYLPWGTASGTIISQKQFWQTSGQAFRKGLSSQGASEEEIESMVGFFAEDAIEDIKDDADLIHDGYAIPRFVHLANAQCLVGGHPIDHSVLRVQLSHVAGWTFGEIRLSR